MTDLNKENLYLDVVHAGEYGNGASLVRTVEDADMDSGDILYMARLPAYTELQDLQLFNGAAGGSAAVKVGYIPVDSANGAGDDDFFIASVSVVSAARTRANTVTPPVLVPYDCYIVVTATASFSSAADITIQLDYEWRGK